MFGKLLRNAIQSSQLGLSKEEFNYKNNAHLEIIEQHIASFNEAANALKAIDYNIFLGITIGSVCYLSSYLLPLVAVSIAGFSSAAHAHAKRGPTYDKYCQALGDLIDIYNWSMGKNTGNHWHKLAVKSIQELILTLGPWVAPDVIHTWEESDLKPNSLNPRNLFNSKRQDISEDFQKKIEDFARGKQVSEFAYRIYGQHGIADLWGTLKSTVVSQVSEAANNLKY